jgi:hypothetical protein
MSTFTITENFLFSPLSIPNCCLWLDAADKTTLFSDSAGTLPVSTGSLTLKCWKDKSTSNNNATNTGSNPTVTFNSLNSLNTVTFTTSNYLNLTSTSLPNGGQNASYFFVLKTTNTGVQVFFSHGPDPAVQYQTPQFFFASQNLYADTYGGTAIYDATTITNNYLVTSFTRNATLNGWLQGSSFVAANNATILGNTGTGFATLGIGRELSVLRYSFIGEIAEVIVYNTDLTTINRQLVEGHLANKWGLQARLPSNHPYYQYRPLTSNLPLPLVPVNPLFVRNLGSPPYSGFPTNITNGYFSPKSVANLNLWLDSADPSTLVTSGTSVTQWNDKSGSGNNGTSVGTISNTGTINKLTALSWSGSGSTYFTGALVNSGTTLTVLSVFLMNSSSYTTARVLSLAKPGFNDFNNTAYTAAIERNSGNFDSYRANSSRGSISGTFGSAVQVCSLYNGTNHTIYKNGTAGTTVASTGNFGYTNYEVAGSFGEESLVPFNGLIGEVIHYNAALTTEQRQKLEGYLAWKWGLVSNLPSTHPYKNIPPSP